MQQVDNSWPKYFYETSLTFYLSSHPSLSSAQAFLCFFACFENYINNNFAKVAVIIPPLAGTIDGRYNYFESLRYLLKYMSRRQKKPT